MLASSLAPRLLHLTLGEVAADVGPNAVVAILRRAPKLQSLSVAMCLQRHDLAAFGAAAAAARGGGAAGAKPLLQELQLTGGAWLDAAAMADLERLFPELEVLAISTLVALSTLGADAAVAAAHGGAPRGGAAGASAVQFSRCERP